MTKVDKLLSEEKLTRHQIQIWGGKLGPEKWQDFIARWNFLGMPYAIIETHNKIKFKKGFTSYDSLDPKMLHRLRIFGESGDLDIRHDFPVIHWRYIGNENLPPKIAEVYKTEDFWAEKNNANKEFFWEEKEAFLWGKYRGEKAGKSIWHEDRVAKARPAYPIDHRPQRVKIKYKVFSEQGHSSFVWFTKLKGGHDRE
ncbi:MAG: hypothetical protein GX996_10945 [Firmicutes bacterium]|nr:hypothetical protein [Bacillota bacterium]